MSTDAVPVMEATLRAAIEDGEQELVDDAAVVLICHAWRRDSYARELPWQSFHLSRYRASQIWQQLESEGSLDSYETWTDDERSWAYFVSAGGKGYDGSRYNWFDDAGSLSREWYHCWDAC